MRVTDFQTLGCFTPVYLAPDPVVSPPTTVAPDAPLVYLAGPMRGYARFNFPAFDTAAVHLRSLGFRVMSPADIDRAYDFDPDRDPVTPELVRECVRRDVAAICSADAVVMLPGWPASKGATAERAVAEWLGVPVFDLAEMRGR
jgi:nucleoside 2-deoxyribosyltransferase